MEISQWQNANVQHYRLVSPETAPTDLQSHGVESIYDPEAVGNVALQRGSTHDHVQHGTLVFGTDVSVSREGRHRQDIAAGHRQDWQHASEASICVMLRYKSINIMKQTKYYHQRAFCKTKNLLFLWWMEASYHSNQVQSSYTAKPKREW